MSELTKIAASQTPYRRRSKLDPHLADLRRLQNEGFSLAQLKVFLTEIGVSVSRQSIYDFLKRRESVPTKTISSPSIATPGNNEVGKVVDSKDKVQPGENPLSGLSGKPRPGGFNPIPSVKIEIDND